MEDELVKKRRTDCVYFLASPLTCKKGSECEFRHCENARLNLRECWYWLNGNCRNPNCTFRHPPLDEFTEPVPSAVPLPPYPAIPMSKSKIPCYFFFNAYCIKGDQCTFLHDISSAQKFPKTASEPTTTNIPEIKTSIESDTGPPIFQRLKLPLEEIANPCEITLELVKKYHPKEVQQPAQCSVLGGNGHSAESSVPECEEPGSKLSDSLLPPVEEGNVSNEHLFTDRSLKELVKVCTEPDEWWESSPGFDMLINDDSEQLACDGDVEYLLARERESEMLHSHLLQYDFEGSDCYETMTYADLGYLYDHRACDTCDHLENRRSPDYFQRDSEHWRESFLEPIIHLKRKPSHRESEVDFRDVDLRSHLRKRIRMDGCRVYRNSGSHRSSQTRGNSRERSMRHGIGPLPPGRLASVVGKNLIGLSHSENELLRNDCRRRDSLGQPSRHARSRHTERERRRRHVKPLPAISKFSHDSVSREAKPARVINASFTGPKTLVQIREEKSRSKAASDGIKSNLPRRLKRPIPEDFDSPRPLNELLEEKRRHASISHDTNGLARMTTRQERLKSVISQAEKGGTDAHMEDSLQNCHGTAEKQDREYDSDFIGEDDDDDGLWKKLADILPQ